MIFMPSRVEAPLPDAPCVQDLGAPALHHGQGPVVEEVHTVL